ncbi:hypothetical protein KAU33_14185 [Candidatus Dependentiae bacterium]|nr:hypothetical protein [Candidatus Dependentiae bacterium]
MKKKEVLSMVIKILGLYFFIQYLPALLLGYKSFFLFILKISDLYALFNLISLSFSSLIPMIIFLLIVIGSDRIAGLLIKEKKEDILIKDFNLEKWQLLVFNTIGVLIIVPSAAILIFQLSQLISFRFSSVDMEVTRKQAWRMAPYLIKLLLGFFLISRAKAIIKFISKIQEPE